MNKKCPECGSYEINLCRPNIKFKLLPLNKLISLGTEVFVEVCKECGLIISFRVNDTKKIKSNRWLK